MRAYSKDLRERIIAAVERGEHSQREIARLFFVSVSFIVRLLQRRRQTGSIDPMPHAGGPVRVLDDAAIERLLKLVDEHPDATLEELRDLLGVSCHISTISKALIKRGISRKKKTFHAEERDDPEVQKQRAAFQRRVGKVSPEHLVFIDETGTTTNMSRRYGRAPKGQRVHAAKPGKWKTLTLLAGLRSTGVVAPLAYEGGTDTVLFEGYVEQVLAPQLQPGDVVVWDNLKPHKSAKAIKAIKNVGARVEPLPVYSPDLTPIEEMFSKLKEYLRSIGARTCEGVIKGLGEGLLNITLSDILGWFSDRCAYAMP